jgi:polysaccharide biosynthesis/export protein
MQSNKHLEIDDHTSWPCIGLCQDFDSVLDIPRGLSRRTNQLSPRASASINRCLVRVAGAGLAIFLTTVCIFASGEVSSVQPKVTANQVQASPDYVLGPGDIITIQAVGVEELSASAKPRGVDPGGHIDLPFIGRLKVAGLTLLQLKAELINRLKVYVKEPDVAVSISEFRSQPVSILGYVNTSGVHQLQGRKTLAEIMSMAGGFRPEAGPVARITRRLEFGPIPLPGASNDPTGQFSVAEVDLKGVMDGLKPEQNILIQPYDVISVPKADIVYIIGEVKKNGGFVLNGKKKVYVMEALAMAEGLQPNANKRKVEILRLVPGSEERKRVPVDLKNIFAGKAVDVAMQPEDILLVPGSIGKNLRTRAAESAVSAVTSMITWGMIY